MKQIIPEIVIVVLLIVFSVLLCNLFWMPMGVVFVVLVCFVLLLGGFAAFIWREKGGDERDVLIRQVASRVAYLCSALILAIGIVYQTLANHVADPWLLGAFIVTVVAKVVGYAYGKSKY